MIERMAKVEILGLKDVSLDAIDLIQDQGTLHIEDLSTKISEISRKRVLPMEIDPKFGEREQKLSILRGKVGDKIRELGADTGDIYLEDIKKDYKEICSEDLDLMISRIEKMLREVEDDCGDPIDQKEDLVVELSRLEKYAPIMQKIQPLADQVSEMSNMASIALIIERKYKAILHYLNEEIGKITNGESEVVSSDVDDESTAALIVFNRTYLKAVHDFLAVQDVNQVRLPSELGRKPIDEAVAEVRVRIAEIPGEIEELDKRLKVLTGKYSVKLIAARNAIQDRLGAMEAMPNFAQTDQIFIISGWMPEEAVKPMQDAMEKQFSEKVIVTVTDIREEEGESDEAPVKLKNGPFVRYFEALYMLSKYPRYGTVDPTIVFAIFFPIFFGIMVGDIGYGAILMALGWWAHRKWCEKPMINMLGYILAVGGAWAILFGVIYMEFFGDLLEKALEHWGVHLPILGSSTSFFKFPINRLEGFVFMMYVSVFLGFIHMGIGLTIGVINGAREKNRKHVMEKGGMLMCITGLMMCLCKVPFSWWPTPIMIVGIILFLGGFVFACIGGGFGGGIESIVGSGNLLSYTRLAGIGLASVIMAQVANDLTRQMWGGVMGIIVAIIIGVLLHTLNIVLAAFSPSIHALRLHLVESFSKFFEPAKIRYEPFRKTGGET